MYSFPNDQLQLAHLHPYEYLTSLNSIYSSCNKASLRTFSSVSKFKLAWKPFSIIKIPQCFQASYIKRGQRQKKKIVQNDGEMDQAEKKIWKDHQYIINKYSKKTKEKNKFHRPKTCTNRKNNTTKIVSGQQNILLKHLINKGIKVDYNKQELQQQVLKKLKSIQNQVPKKTLIRAQTAFPTKKLVNCEQSMKQNQPNNEKLSFKRYLPQQNKKLKQNQYLNYNKNCQIVQDFKNRIKQVDCAISEQNVKKASKILKNMENIAQTLK